MTNFEKWNKEFNSQNLFAFNGNSNGILWLKIRTITRKGIIDKFIEDNKINLKSKKLSDLNVELFEWAELNDPTMGKIDEFLRDRNNEWYISKGVDENKLKVELMKVKCINQGGGVANSLDQTFVRLYVKQISDYEELCSHYAEISATSWNFVQTSWYNNWTSFLIESLFKNKGYENVLPAVGETKSVDFFIDNIPFDLKVTYLSSDFIDAEFIKIKGNRELVWLKKQAILNGIKIQEGLTDKEQYQHLIEELELLGKSSVINELHKTHKLIIDQARNNPENYLKWLYEHQSARLFGAENRLFIVLIDALNIFDSWKMKRAFTKIDPIVESYIKGFNEAKLKRISFNFNKKTYKVLSDIIFVVKE